MASSVQMMLDQATAGTPISPTLLAGLVGTESSWNPNAVSPQGAYGLTGIMPSTAANPGYGVPPLPPGASPQDQLRFAAQYLTARGRAAGLTDADFGDPSKVKAALVAYHGRGTDAVGESGPNYANKVLGMSGSSEAATGLGIQSPAQALGAMGGVFQQTAAGVQKDMAEQSAIKQKYLDQSIEQARQDQARYDQIAKDYKPVDVSKPPQVPENDPLKAFGSAASVFAVLASALTHTPAINAMNGLASAINATKANDWKAYEEGYKQWKENTEIALKMHEVQASDMKAALDAMKSHLETGAAMGAAAAARSGDAAAAKMLNLHLFEEYNDYMQKKQQAGAAMQESFIRSQEYLQSITPTKLANQALAEKQQALDAATKSGDPNKIATAQAEVETAKGRVYDAERQERAATAISIQKPEILVDQDGKPITRVFGSDGTVAYFSASGEREYPTSVMKPGTTKSPEGRSAGTPLTPDELASAGGQVASGMPLSQVVPGYGPSSATQRGQARAEAIKIIQKQTGLSPELAGVELANRTIEYGSGKRSSSQITTMLGATQQAIGQLDYNIKKTKEEMAKLGSSDLSPIINAIARGEEKWTGNPAYSSLFYYMSATAQESARILSGGQASIAQLHVDAANEAKKWADVNMTPASFDAIAESMLDEGKNRIETFQKALDYQRLTGAGQYRDAATPAAPTPNVSSQTPPVPGARLAPDNKWYVPDPARPGKYLEVRP